MNHFPNVASSIHRGLKALSRHQLTRTRFKSTPAFENATPAARATERKAAESSIKNGSSATTASSADAVPIGSTLVAMSLAIATVSGVAAITETSTASSCPKFDPQSQRFDQSTFTGRLSKMLLACDPFLLTYSTDEVMRCKEMVQDYQRMYEEKEVGVSEVELNRKLWEAQVCDTVMHIVRYISSDMCLPC